MNFIIKILKIPYRLMRRVLSFFHYLMSLIYIRTNKRKVLLKIKNDDALNVIFIIQYIPGWNKLEPIYSKMKNDDRFNPLILCVPINIENNTLLYESNQNDTYNYFTEHGYEAINAIGSNGDWVDIKSLNPDYVFHSRPYNHFMPKCYKSGAIRKFALIFNVLYGACMAINGQKVTINWDYYRDTFCYFSFDFSEKVYYESLFSIGIKLGIQKCFPYGGVGLEQMLDVKQEKVSNSFCKTVLWTPRWSTDPFIGGSNFFNYKDTIFSLAEKFADILFIIRPHPLMFSNFIKTGEMSVEDVDEFKSFCNNAKNICLDESKEYSDSFWQSDFIITDVSAIVSEYFITKKPVIYCHADINPQYTQYAEELIKNCYEVNNSDDLINHFEMLVEDNDYKLKDRDDFIKKYFNGVQNNSRNIVNYMTELVDNIEL